MKWSTGAGPALALSVLLMQPALHGQAARTGDGPAASTASSADDMFVREMTVANLAEVELGRMASERASNPDVKAFGQMMVTDHSKANMELAESASRLNVHPPADLDPKHKDLRDRLAKLQGAAFDRAYIDAMVQGHGEVLGKLRTKAGVQGAADKAAGKPGSHDSLTQWAMKAIPTVEQHQERARAIQTKLGK